MDTPDLELLERQECLRLLGTASVGRVVFTSGALPAVEPARFVLDGGRIVFGVWDGPKLVTAPQGTVVAFQADALEETTRIAWSVTVVGKARALDDITADRYRVSGALPSSKPNGAHDTIIAVDLDLVSGHRAHTASAA